MTGAAAVLVRGGEVLCPVEVATTRRQRGRGLLGRDGVNGAFLLPGIRSVHTIGMRFPIDVAHLDRNGRVLRCRTMRRHRLGRAALRARSVLEAEAGSFERWGLRPGDVVEVR